MRVDHALRAAGGARGVTHAAGIILLLVWIGEITARLRKPLLVVLIPLDGLTAQRHDPDALELDLISQALEQGQQDIVDDQETILRMPDDVDQIIRRQPQVQGVDHAARRRDAEIGFQMRIMIPHQRRHPIARL